jgi:cytochrome c oxidase subunit 2
VKLANGETLTVNNDYIRESILNPQAKIVAGFPPIMPTFQGQVSEEQLLALTEYIKSLAPATSAPGGAGSQPSGPQQPAGNQPAGESQPRQ